MFGRLWPPAGPRDPPEDSRELACGPEARLQAVTPRFGLVREITFRWPQPHQRRCWPTAPR